MENYFFTQISKLGIVLGAFWALIQFWSANEFKKAQYLSELWRKFYTTDKYVEIFNILDSDSLDLRLLEFIEPKDIFSYLAFLEEIVIFRKTNFFHIYKIRDKNLINLFQYHFYNVYLKESKKQDLFWKKIEENPNSASWKFQREFAKKCAININRN